jgi:hypothetical protein
MKTTISTTIAVFLLVSAASTSQSAAQSMWDGKWKASIEYSKRSSSNPECSGHLFPDPFVVKNGQIVGILNHSDRGTIFLSGKVAKDGSFAASGAGSDVEAKATGKLTNVTGNGTWEETSNTYCDGTWSAVRK